MINPGDYVKFLFTSHNRSFSFRTYNDETGREVGFIDGYNKDGSPIYHRWKFDQDGLRKISVHKNKVDRNGLNAVEFLRKSPNCVGSPTGTYIGDGTQVDLYFKEVNEEKDAKVLVDEEMIRLEAVNAAVKVKGQDFIDLCALLNTFNKDESVMRIALIDYAKVAPEKFLDLVNDKSRQTRSIIRRGVNAGIIQKQGKIYSWEDLVLGVDEDSAVAKLITDEKLVSAIKTHLEKLK